MDQNLTCGYPIWKRLAFVKTNEWWGREKRGIFCFHVWILVPQLFSIAYGFNFKAMLLKYLGKPSFIFSFSDAFFSATFSSGLKVRNNGFSSSIERISQAPFVQQITIDDC